MDGHLADIKTVAGCKSDMWGVVIRGGSHVPDDCCVVTIVSCHGVGVIAMKRCYQETRSLNKSASILTPRFTRAHRVWSAYADLDQHRKTVCL